MVSAEQKDLVAEHNLLGKEVRQQLQTEAAAVDVIAEEEKRAGREMDTQGPHHAGEGEQVGEIAVEISEYKGWRFQLEKARLGREDGA